MGDSSEHSAHSARTVRALLRTASRAVLEGLTLRLVLSFGVGPLLNQVAVGLIQSMPWRSGGGRRRRARPRDGDSRAARARRAAR